MQALYSGQIDILLYNVAETLYKDIGEGGNHMTAELKQKIEDLSLKLEQLRGYL